MKAPNELTFKVSLEYEAIEKVRRVLESAQAEIARLRRENRELRAALAKHKVPAVVYREIGPGGRRG